MKNRTNLSIKIVTLFAFLLSTALFTKLEAQITSQVNGRSLLLLNGTYYDVTTPDSMVVDVEHITIKFIAGQKNIGITEVLKLYSIAVVGSIEKDYIDFILPLNYDYIDLITEIEKQTYVEKLSISHNLVPYTKPLPNDPGCGISPMTEEHAWYLNLLNLYDAWEITTGDPAIKIALIDDGYDISDLDINNEQSLNWNSITMTNNVTPTGQSHGNSMSSIIASRTNNGTDMFGIAGGWAGIGGCSTFMISIGPNFAEWAVDDAINKAVSNGARVINMSWGAIGWYNPSIDQAIQDAYANGVVMFAAVGNSNGNVAWPATHEHVIAVGGVNELDTRWHLGQEGSCFGPETEISTISGRSSIGNDFSVYFKWLANTVEYNDVKTSGACAIASAIAALMLSINPCLTADQVRDILIQSCEKVGGYDYYWDPNNPGHSIQLGYGRVNALTAVQLAMGEEGKELTANETWTTNRNFRSEIIIPAGKTLTLQNMTLKMWEDAGITVKKGGRLTIINSTATATCNGMWKGITVEGDNALTQQYYSNQGYLTMQNSTIEHTKNGVTTTRGGGIIQAANSHFVNNTMALNIGLYSLSNYRTSFSVCDFIVNNEHRDWSHFQSLVYIYNNLGIKFYGCSFKNDFTQNGSKGYGISSYGSHYLVDGSCSNPLISPCPENSVIRSVFRNLEYGVKSYYSTNGKIVIDHSNFQDNDRGIYFSNCNYADVLRCNFTIPDYYLPSGLTPYGVYFNYGTGYHIEANAFQCNTANTTGSVGLYILSSGGAQNYVYNNTFARLSRAAVADGVNRIAGGATGLCYKCNDFTSNGTDIDIVRAPNTPLLTTHGISYYQGLPSAGSASTNKDTLAASNTFSSSQNVWNIRNENNISNYYYQEYYPPQVKIIPDQVLNIDRFVNYSTTYTKSLVCKSRIYGGGMIGSELLASKNAALANAEAAGLVLQNTVDGGNTANLTFDVIGSSPSEALELRNQLILESPYLSDTVMKTAIDRENVLPNAMLRDILVENPQAAKSDELVSMLDERWEPMPDYMKDEIASGKTVIGGREQLEAKHDGWLQQISYLNNQIIANYLGDTVNPNAINELKAYLQNENTKQSGFELADICLQKGDYNGAAQAISSLQANFTLSESESQQATDCLTLSTIIAGLQADTMAFNEVDSLHAVPLYTLYNNSENNASVIARDILIASGNLNYQEPINGGVNSKSAVVEIPANKHVNAAKRKMEQISVFPNPAANYTIIEYILPAKAVNASLSICNVNGNILWQQDIKKAKDQLVVDLSGFASGNYTVSLLSGKQPIATKTITISK